MGETSLQKVTLTASVLHMMTAAIAGNIPKPVLVAAVSSEFIAMHHSSEKAGSPKAAGS